MGGDECWGSLCQKDEEEGLEAGGITCCDLLFGVGGSDKKEAELKIFSLA